MNYEKQIQYKKSQEILFSSRFVVIKWASFQILISFLSSIKRIKLDMLHALFENPPWYKDLVGDWRTNIELFLNQRWIMGGRPELDSE